MWPNDRAAHTVAKSGFLIGALGSFQGPPLLESPPPATNLAWSAVYNQFFALAVMPPTNVVASELVFRQITLPPVRNETNTLPAAGTTTANLWMFDEGDFKDAAAFANRLKAGQDGLSANLFSRLSDETKRLLSAYATGPVAKPMLQALMSDLSKTLYTPAYAQENRGFYAVLTLRPANSTHLYTN